MRWEDRCKALSGLQCCLIWDLWIGKQMQISPCSILFSAELILVSNVCPISSLPFPDLPQQWFYAMAQ